MCGAAGDGWVEQHVRTCLPGRTRSAITVIEPLPLPAGPAAAGLARRHLEQALADWPADPQGTAVLLVSELVSNAVVHGRPPVTLSIHLSPGRDLLRVEVHDGDPRLPPTPDAERSDTAEHGRGLQILDALAATWGSQHTDRTPGKTSWFELRRT